MARHNLRTVVEFEFTRTIKKRRFWIATLAIPVLLGIVFALVFASSSATQSRADAQKNQTLSFSYTDASGLIDPKLATAMGGALETDPGSAVERVKEGKLDAFFSIPANPTKEPVQVYGADQGIFKNGTYDAVATQLVVLSAQEKVGSAELTALVQGKFSTETQTFKDGQPSGGLETVVPPLLFLVLFYVVIILLANQMLASTLEEKENRVTEMILTTLNPTTLVVGKVISLFLVGALQAVVFAAPMVLGYLFFREQLALPDFDLSHLQLQPLPMLVGALLFIGGFILFTGVLVGIGAVMPTAKDASMVFGPVMIMMFIPFYIVSMIVSDPGSVIVKIFTYFPFTAPITAMLRNAFGSLSGFSAAVVIVELFVFGFLALRVAVHLFRYGSIEYNRKLSLRTAFSRKG
ncbi:ABC transporter, permease protein [Arthrobacter sp. PAMC 25486]|uniref:ABC transporter permease n=1 Tax=Arthrobacter sp. PAMC 25486 TaxID=1494608 RepID=UPI0005362883|nr:ABC transporter permease [Arthrobacter sp. PAMC 25486]AIY01884.1 ABC transporter, permease protein [Arthrobacter sp. PAMC 25486]